MNDIRKELAGYFSLSGYLIPQADAEQAIREGVSFRGTNILILIFAIFIASLGLNTNSTAVIIGAMLISPLMGPIIGLGLGVGIADYSLLKRSLRNLTVAATFSVLTSTCYFLISPVSEGHSELLARTSPTIYDVLIGFFGGAAGIFAIASKNKGNVIPGVAIATALMPPLCTVGYGLATWQMHYFLGALYLFLINSIFIGFATFIGVKVMKFEKVHTADPVRSRKVQRVIYAVAILTMLPSIYLTYSMLRQERFQMNVERFVTSECRFPATKVLNYTATRAHRDEPAEVTVTLIGKVLPQDSLTVALSSKLQYYGIGGAQLNIVQGEGGGFTAADLAGHSVAQLYEITQNALVQKQHIIDSLRNELAGVKAAEGVATRLAPELKVVFPEVAEIGVSRTVIGNVATEQPDTANVALVHFSKPVGANRQNELARYLAARLGVEKVEIVSIPAM